MRAYPDVNRGMGLESCIDREDLLIERGKAHPHVDRSGRLSRSALLIGDGDNAPLPLADLREAQFSINEQSTAFIQNGGRVRGITDFSYPYVEAIRKNLTMGENMRYFPQYQVIFMLVGDEKESISSINVDVESLSMDTSVVALWTDDPTYAEYLMSTFELLWQRSVPAEKQTEELLTERPRQV